MRSKSIAIPLLIQVCSLLCARADGTPDILWQEAATYGYTTTAVAVSSDGLYAASPGNGGVQIWRVADGSKVAALAYGSWIVNLAFSPDGLYLAASGASPRLSVWRVSDWSLVYTLSDVSSGPVAFSPDSSMLAVASNTVIQLRVATNGVLLTSWTNPPVNLGGITALTFSPDGAKLASGGGARGTDLNLKIWSVPSGNLLLNIPTAQTYGVGFAAFSPDGSLVATAGGEFPYGPAQLWRAADGALVKTFPEGAFAVAFTPDSKMAVVAGTNVAIYAVPSGVLIRHYADAGSHYQRAVATTSDGQVYLRAAFAGQIYAARLPLFISSFTQAGSDGLLSWIGTGSHYQVQQRTNLVDGAWQNFGDVTTNKAAEIPIQLPGAFYRVMVITN